MYWDILFFFQAEDGIRDIGVTGVQTCALPIADDESLFLAEQVWDDQPPSAEGTEFVPGEPTFSATPLSWTHAGFVRLAHAVDAGRPVDTPDVVACHFGTSLCQG